MQSKIFAAVGALGVAAIVGVASFTAGGSGTTVTASEPTGSAGTSTVGTTRTVGVTQTVAVTRTVAITPTPSTGEGCTPGYWKVTPHLDSWPPTGYSTGQTLESVFDVPNAYGVDNATLLAALSFGGGPTTTDAAKLLLHHAVAALLNSAHPGVDYPWSTADVISATNAALATDDRDTMLALKGDFDEDNNAGCSLN